MNNEILLIVSVVIFPAYVFGSCNGAIIVSRLFYRKDIRKFGSGNAGLTNFYRVFGKAGVIPVIIIDVLKTVIPVLFGGWIFAHFFSMLPSVTFPFGWFISESFFGQALAGFAVILGHCFPVFSRFKGGKGVMAIGAIVIIIDWRLALAAWGVFLLVTAVSRYVSLGAILGNIAIPLSMVYLDIKGLAGFGIAEFSIIILCVLLIVIRHTDNIKRLFKGEESKLVFKRRTGQNHAGTSKK